MNSTIKIILTLAAVVGTVFALTAISQYTRKSDPKPDPDKPGNSIDVAVHYTRTQLKYDPVSAYPAHRTFPGHFEVGDKITAYFWLLNQNPMEVRVSGHRRSCTSCTDVSIAVFDKPDSIPGLVMPMASILGSVAFGAPDYFVAPEWSAAAEAISPDRWQALNFDKPDVTLTIPPASGVGSTWVVVRMRITAQSGPHLTRAGKIPTADLAFLVDGVKTPMQTTFAVEYIGVDPFGIFPHELKFGDLVESADEKTLDVTYFSSTQANLPPPVLAADRKDKFLTFDEPKRLTADELKQFIESQGGAKEGVRILAAYRVPVKLNRKAGAQELDIGPLEKSFTLTASSGSGANYSVQGQVKATVSGAFALQGGAGVIDLGEYDGRTGAKKEAMLTTEKTDLELEVLAGGHHPDFLQATLGTPRIEGSRRYWPVTVTIDANFGLRHLEPDSAVAFRVKSTGQIIRIPVKGHGSLR